GNNLLSCIRQTFRCNNIQAAISQFLRADFGVVAFQTNDNRDVNPHFRYRADDTVSDQVATYDTAEDVNQNRFNIVVREDDFERFGHALFGRTAANVEEVSRFAAVQLNDVHGT